MRLLWVSRAGENHKRKGSSAASESSAWRRVGPSEAPNGRRNLLPYVLGSSGLGRVCNLLSLRGATESGAPEEAFHGPRTTLSNGEAGRLAGLLVQPCVTSNRRARPAEVRSNPSIERTSSSKLRLLPAAAHVER